MKQRIEINVPLGYVAEVVHNTKYPELSTHIENEADNVWKEIILKKAPYYNELQKLLAEDYEDIGTDGPIEDTDMVITNEGLIKTGYACAQGNHGFTWGSPPIAILRKKKLTGVAWLKAQKEGTVFKRKDATYVIWRGRTINERLVSTRFWNGNWQKDCSDETCEILK